jgi:hypothetical protein
LRIRSIFETGSATRVSLTHQKELLEALRPPEYIDTVQYLQHCRWSKLECAMCMRVEFCGEACQLAVGRRNLQALRHGIDEVDAALLVPRMFGQDILWRCCLSEVMNESGETNFGVVGQPRSLLEDHERVDSAIDLRVPLLGLRNTEQCIDFRKDRCERAAVAQHFEKDLWVGSGQGGFGFLPHPLGHQRVGLCGIPWH